MWGSTPRPAREPGSLDPVWANRSLFFTQTTLSLERVRTRLFLGQLRNSCRVDLVVALHKKTLSLVRYRPCIGRFNDAL